MKNSFCDWSCRFIAALALAASAASIVIAGEAPAEDSTKQAAPTDEAEAKELERQAEALERARAAWEIAGTKVLLDIGSNAESLVGIDVSPADDVLRSHLGLGEGKGLVVTQVSEGGAAEQAGIQVNDIIVSVGNEEVGGVDRFLELLRESLDKPVAVSFLRAGQRQSVDMRPRDVQSLAVLDSGEPVREAAEPRYWLGVGLAAADNVLRSQLGIPEGEGLVVTAVEPESPAAKAGLMANDLLLKLDGKSLKTVEALSEQLQQVAKNSAMLVLRRRGKPASLSVTPELHSQPFRLSVQLDELARAVEIENQRAAVQLLKDYDERIRAHALAASDAAANQTLQQQVDALLEQANQLRTAVEALQTAIKAQSQTRKSDEQQE